MSTTKVPHWLLFRLAPRAIEAVQRHQDDSGVLGTYVHTLVPAAERFMQLYSGRQTQESSLRVTHSQRRQALARLRVTLRSWVAFLSDSLPGLDPSVLGDSPTVAEDLIADAESLLELAARHETSGRPAVVGLDAMKLELTAAIDAARIEANDSTQAAAELSLARTELRDAASELQAQLVSFRQVLRYQLGSTHPDYVRLRVNRRGRLRDDDDRSGEEDAAEMMQGA